MITNIQNKKVIFYSIIFIATVVYCITAFNSHGFFHADEHYQIIEFAGIKQGTHAPHELAWEYNAKIRPALQPAIASILLETMDSVGITDPYNKMIVFRLLTALMAITIITFFIRKTEHPYSNSKQLQISYYLLSFLLWFSPLIYVRFSSETWSGMFFLLALGLFYSKSDKKFSPVLIGLALGLSFLFRFQIAFAILFFGIWLIIINKSRFPYLLKMGSAFLIMILFGFMIDSWFYEEYVFTPWKYFQENIINDTASNFGTSPWYFYIKKMISYPNQLIGIFLLISFIVLLIFQPKNLILWCTIAFIAGHSVIAHKEERFLFPVVFLIPVILIEAIKELKIRIPPNFSIRLLYRFYIIVFIIVNIVGLTAISQKAAGIGRMEITKYIHNNYRDKKINLISTSWANPYNPWGLPMKFYVEKNISYQQINSICELNDSLFLKEPNVINLITIRKYDVKNKKCDNVTKENGFNLKLQSIPSWIQSLNRNNNYYNNEEIIELYEYLPSAIGVSRVN